MPKIDLQTGKSPVNIIAFSKSQVFDEAGRSFKMVDLWQERTTIFVFLRHFGCVSCRAHAVQVWGEKEKYEQKGARLVFVGNGSPHFIQTFKQDLNLQGAPIYTDPSLESFRAVGFKRGFLAALGPRSLVRGAQMFAQGHRQGAYDKNTGDLWQMGGVVAIKPSGEIAYHYISEVLGDYPPEADVSAK